ncbi:protein inscuteable homolog [Periplaneta americana]|uniref:protein inscuteable homolog n=1 Tax=Periplaneta americana TaxID=6978 RepID=UPI0037E90A47
MGEFQRSRSKVWWSNYVEADTEDDESQNRGWGGAGLVLSPSRGSSSSPSSSHKSQDSGFSDSEASTAPAGSTQNFKHSPLPSEEPAQTQEEGTSQQACECPQQKQNESVSQTKAETSASEETNSLQVKSPARKLKGQFFSPCACLGQTSQTDIPASTAINSEEQALNKVSGSPEKSTDFSSQLPVRILREKFLQDCMCLNQEPKRPLNSVGKSPVDKPNSPPRVQQQVCHKENQRTEIGSEKKELQDNQQENTRGQEEQSSPNRSQVPLSRSLPVPTLRTPQRVQNKSNKESPRASPRKLHNQSQCPSPRQVPSEGSNQQSPKQNNEHLNSSQCESLPREDSSDSQQLPKQNNGNSFQCNSRKPTPRRLSEGSSQHLTNENLNLSVQSQRSQACNTPLSNQSAGSDSIVRSERKLLSLELPERLGSPAHTSTPKPTTAAAATPSKLFVTPNRPLRCLGLGKKHGRPVNLLNNFKSGLQPEGADSERSPVQQWLGELAALYEPECMTTLQSKSLAVDLSHQVAVMAAAATETVKTLQESTKLISTEFAKLCQQLEYGKMEHIGPLVQSLIGLVTEFLHEHCKKGDEGGKDSQVDRKKLVEVCDRLRLTAAKQPPDKDQLTSEIAELGNKFTGIVDNILIQHISVLVGVLEEPSSDMALRSALSSLTTLGLEGPHLSRLVAQCSGVRALLAVCLESRSSTIRTAALRALATVCCVVEAIRQLEQAGGVEILSEILSEESRPEPEVSEAAAVLAQITAPWVEDNHNVQGLSEQLSPLVKSLTRLANGTASCETLLLSAAALANLTFMEPRTVWPLLEQGSAGKLLQAVKRRGPKVSVFLQEQAATLLANMAAVPESRPHLAEQRAVVALLCFLQIRHSPLQRAPEIAAAERVQQKSAIALSRLCSDPVVAAQVVELQGVNRLVRLCKEERERNHSDGVLVACLAALRKIAANCGTKVIEDLDAMELVEPRLLDSFLIYSSRQESYV